MRKTIRCGQMATPSEHSEWGNALSLHSGCDTAREMYIFDRRLKWIRQKGEQKRGRGRGRPHATTGYNIMFRGRDFMIFRCSHFFVKISSSEVS